MGRLLLFDISGGELIVILLFALLFFGSKGIPDLARTLGRTMRQVRDASNEVQREIQRGANEVTRTVNEQRRAFQQEVAAAQAKQSTIPPPPGEGPDPEPPPSDEQPGT
ncbi:MAG TPA: twin-arginine translocase TatA/TatE family subunit [Flavobacteriales bacterium]|nr:twin-arginine translocase TatA/TatE family subunit [Flavobacteriales bacterium]